MKPITLGLSRDLCRPELITDEQQMNKTLVRESWKKAIHYSSDSSQPSESSPILQLCLDLSLSSSPFLTHFSLPLPYFCPVVFFSVFVSLFIFIFPNTRHFSCPCNLVWTHTTAHVHTHMPVSDGTLGYLVCSHDTDVPEPPKQQRAHSRHTVHPWTCEDNPLTQ